MSLCSTEMEDKNLHFSVSLSVHFSGFGFCAVTSLKINNLKAVMIQPFCLMLSGYCNLIGLLVSMQ